MAGNAANLIPRKKGESQSQFISRVHDETLKRRGVRSAKGEGRNLTKYAPREVSKQTPTPMIKGRSRPEPKASAGLTPSKAAPMRERKYVTTGVQIGNPFRGERIGRIRERVKA